MPKPAIPSRHKNTDVQTATPRASASASIGTDNDSPDAPPDKTYTMCKALCKEMSESVLRCINERFDAFETKFHALAGSQAELQARVASQEQAPTELDTCMLTLKGRYSELAKCNSQLRDKVQDLEARSRRHNIKIVGIKEGEEGGKPTEFVSKLIPELFGTKHFPHPLKVDRAHRSLQPKPAAGAKPRIILARIHHFQDKELILCRGRQQPLEYKGSKVLIFPDYTSEVMAQRRAFRDVMQALRDRGVKHTLRYPTRLHVYSWDGEAPTIFADPDEAARSLARSNIREGE